MGTFGATAQNKAGNGTKHQIGFKRATASGAGGGDRN